MDYLVLWFILTSDPPQPVGYIPPQDVKAEDRICNVDGPVVGLQFDRSPNPTLAFFMDPNDPTKHCIVSIQSRVTGLVPGVYHLAYTHMGSGQPVTWHIPDPHTSDSWERVPDTRPSNIRIKP